MSPPLAIVLAAGKGTRMASELPKVLVTVRGRPMVRYVLDALREAGVERILVVVGYQADLVRHELADESGVDFVEQTQQLGTGHAVMMCRRQLAGHDGPVLVLAGDSPMTQASSLRSLLREFNRERPACLLGTATKENPAGLGRILRDDLGNFAGIVEDKDATVDQRKITEVNMSTYVFNSRDLLGALDRLTTGNAAGEYYVTDCPGILKREGKKVTALCALEPCESLSINTLSELAAVEAEMALRATCQFNE
jgi:bifunctional UDP-N-acetylglucosamine pyrophosphorylase/glucosamine-1-phosphate N-acetyltransferase/UDP-N-acetylglucosamine pyrophosphorylase